MNLIQKNKLPVLMLSLTACLIILAQCSRSASFPSTLLWSDEFDGPELDAGKWNVEVGTGSQYANELFRWGNNEAQYYSKENVYIKDGKLIIEPKKEKAPMSNYTSGKINTAGTRHPDGTVNPAKYFVKMGRVEARIRAPKGQGLWPCFWLVGSDYSKYHSEWPAGAERTPAWTENRKMPIGWPKCGEIDVFEMNARNDNKYGATLHYGEWWPKNVWTTKDFVYKESLSKKWHTYGIIWDSEIVKYTFDGKVWAELSLESLGEGSYVYGDSFTSPYGYSIIFCLAIGGNYLNNELPLDSTWDGPLEDRCLEVDWVRVYGK